MSLIGAAVITVVLICAVAGALAALRDDEHGLGKEFKEGLHAIGQIFLPVAGIMASIPFLSAIIRGVLGPAFQRIGADPAMAATSLLAVDMGAYQLAFDLKQSPESWIMAMFTGCMAGATIVFSIPVGLALLPARDHKYLALGMMPGLLAIPIGVFASCLLVMLLGASVRPLPSTTADSDLPLAMTLPTILLNLTPLAAFVGALAFGLRLAPGAMIRAFMVFGRIVNALIVLVVVATIVQFLTTVFYGEGLFTTLFGGWRFDPVMADAEQIKGQLVEKLPITDQEQIPDLSEYTTRALEVAGMIGLMLAGAFPMVYLIKKHLSGPMERLGGIVGLRPAGAAGLLAASANILAMYHLAPAMRARDKVRVIAFAACAAFVFGDHLAFTSNFQPTLLPAVMFGKLAGGAIAFVLAGWLAVPMAERLEWEDEKADVQALLGHVPLLREQELTVSLLEGGLTNRNYRLSCADGEAYVLRIARPQAEVLGIDRDREAACTRTAAASGVAPEMLTYLPEQVTMIRRFVQGRTLTAADLRQSSTLQQAAAALWKCHNQPAPAEAADFSPFAAARSYLGQAQARKVALPAQAELDRALQLLERLEQELPPVEPPCLCHNDLLPANFIDDDGRMWVIDWEYAARGDRFFDLGNLAANGEFTADQEQLLLESYFGEARPEDLRRLRRMRRVSDFREAMWGYLQSNLSTLHDPRYYRDYGRKHLDRFLAAGPPA